MSRCKVEINRRHMRYEAMEKLYKECNDTKLKFKLLALLKIYEGKPSTTVAKELKISDSTVREWLNRYNKSGIEGLTPKSKPAKEWKLSEEQKKQVYGILLKSPREAGFNQSNWSMRLLKLWIEKNININYQQSSLYDLVHRLGFSLQRPKKQSKNADPQKQEEFKNQLKDIVENLDEDTVILYEDEAIITTEPTTTCKWSPVGQQPIVETNSSGSRKRKVIYGAVDPANSSVIYSTEDSGNSKGFESFLK